MSEAENEERENANQEARYQYDQDQQNQRWLAGLSKWQACWNARRYSGRKVERQHINHVQGIHQETQHCCREARRMVRQKQYRPVRAN